MIVPVGLDLLPVAKINALSRESRKNYYLALLRKLLSANQNGLNVTEVEKELNFRGGKGVSFNRKTLLNYFAQLTGTREAYYETVGNTLVFKPNGRLLHGEKTSFFKYDDTEFYCFKIDNPNLGSEKLFWIQERKQTTTGNKIIGGIILPETKMFEFLSALDGAINKKVMQ